MERKEELKSEILGLAKEYYKEAFAVRKEFAPGDRVNYAGRVFDEKELCNLIEASLEFWLTAGKWTEKFGGGLAEILGVKYCSVVNSGSSANLLAFMALTSDKLGDRRIKKGDEVITVAAGFPTTIAPILQYGAVPVFLDITLPQYNIKVADLEKALTPKTKAVMLAHTLGNPFDLQTVREFCDRNGLWLIEDNCDALGSQFYYNGEWKYTGTIGHIGTSSFYPPHHITMGEGGAVYTDDIQLYRIINSFRDWGRDCWCNPGQDGSCGKRYDQVFGELPFGYDHKYVYSHFGYNLKATDMQAAIGCAQLEKLGMFTRKRVHNFELLREKLLSYEDKLILPEAEKNARPSWFGFLITVRNDAGFTRDELTSWLERNNIQTRNLFAGNIIRHPCFDGIRGQEDVYRVIGDLSATDQVTTDTFWLGVYPGMSEEKISYMDEMIGRFIRNET